MEETIEVPAIILNTTDIDFVFWLAYLALEHEVNAATSTAAKQQVAWLLDRLTSIDPRRK